MLPTGTMLGPYQVIALLGKGGMGEVYRARDTRLGRDVAVKVIAPDQAQGDTHRFEQEARAAGALNHPNVCAVFDVGTHGGSPFVVMELLEGMSLRARLNQGPIPARKAIDWAAQAAHGLAAAHEKGIVHRDLKPENLFLTKDGRIKVLDFGLAKLTRPELLAPAGEEALTIVATRSGAMLGTAGYMAPEQVRGENADHRADLFALGAVAYELLTGKRAFVGESLYETSYRIVHIDPPPLSASGREIPGGLEAIVGRCLEKSPDERFQSAKDLAFDLEAVGDSAQGSSRAGKASGAFSGAALRRRHASTLVLAAALTVVAVVCFLVWRTRPVGLAQVTYTQLTFQRGTINAARFSPDGEAVFYGASWGDRPGEIFETRPGFHTSRAVGLVNTTLLNISRNGTMAVLVAPDSSGSLWTLAEVPMSGGTPRRVLDDVRSADWLSGGTTLAISRRVAGKDRLEMPPGSVLYETAGELATVRSSGDGKWVSFLERPLPGDTRGSYVIIDTAGRIVARTAEWNVPLGAEWSADGRELWFCGTQDIGSSELRGIAPDGKQRVVTRFAGEMVLRDIEPNGRVLLVRTSFTSRMRGRMAPDEEEHELTWFDFSMPRDISSDGRSLLFSEAGVFGGSHYAVCLRGLDGSPPVRLGEGFAFALSPDGRRALALHFGPPQTLVLLPTGAGDLISVPRGPIDRYYSARWLPDGKSIVFAASEAGRVRRTYVQDLAGGLPRAISPEGFAGALVSPDGRDVVVRSTVDRRLYLCHIGGDSLSLVPELSGMGGVVRWAADGSSVFFQENRVFAD